MPAPLRESTGRARFLVPNPDALPTTPRDLTAALRAGAALEHGEVLKVEITEHTRTTISNLSFLEVEYSAGSAPALPTRLLLKWPLATPAPLEAAEIHFYRTLAPALPSPPIVRCLATAEPSSDYRWLVLQDLRSTHTHPPWPVRPADTEVRGAVAVLARLHARWWDSPALGSDVGTMHTEAGLRAMVHGISAHLPAFIEDLGDDLPRADRTELEIVFSSPLRPWLRLVERRALSIIHGDAHTWNFLFPRSGKGTPYLIDWQTWHLDVGARDLAYLIALHWDSNTRRRLELPLLTFYHEQLQEAGVSNYSFDDLWLDYRQCVVRNLTFPIIYWSRAFPRDRWRGRLDCALAAYRELSGADLR